MTADEMAVEPAADAFWMPSQEMVEPVVKGIRREPTPLLCDREDCEF
jgi:hypothetical protein